MPISAPVPAHLQHADAIADLLAAHFAALNTQLGWAHYLADVEALRGHVIAKITADHASSRYLVLEVDGLLVGFANTLMQETAGELLIVLATPDATEAMIESLIDAALATLKQAGATRIYAEATLLDGMVRKLLFAKGASLLSEKLVLR